MTNINNTLARINWIRASGKYVLIDPKDKTNILYLDERPYQRLLNIALSNDISLEVLSHPDDTRETVYDRFGVSTEGKGTPPINDLRAKLSSMFTLRTGWVVKESMIQFKRNFKQFFPTYYRDIGSWLNVKNPMFAISAVRIMSNKLDFMRLKSNINFVILYLRVASIALNQYLAGTPLKSTQQLGKRIRLINGIPALIPAPLRDRIREGDRMTIIIISSLLHAYKGFKGIAKSFSLDTITAPHSTNVFSLSTYLQLKGTLNPSSYDKEVTRPDLSSKEVLDMDDVEYDDFTIGGRLEWRSIVDSINMNQSNLKRDEADSLVPKFWKDFNPKGVIPSLVVAFPHFPLILTASPTGTSIMSSCWDAVAIVRQKGVLDLFLDYVDSANEVMVRRYNKGRVSDDASIISHIVNVGNTYFTNLVLKPSYRSSFDAMVVKLGLMGLSSGYDSTISHHDNVDNIAKSLPRGKLALKFEAAGKVRVFAIGDYWSQFLLKPLHESLFSVLKSHPCDATFDQIGKVKEFTDRKYRYVASYDLKSATDLIPQHLYEDVLAGWTSRKFASVWMEVLVNRGYLSPKSKDNRDRGFIYYTRGQPMGLLSSWASLALVHHYLVFLSAHRAGISHFRDYLVLGDDIVIGDRNVADKYVEVCDFYGIPIGLPKSFVSEEGFFQFASQNIWHGQNISPISLKEVLMVSNYAQYFGPSTSLSMKVEWIRRLREKDFISANILSSMKAIMTFSERRRFGKSLIRGTIPSDRMNTICSILVSDFKSFTNTIQIDNFLAAMNGEYGIFTGTFKSDSELRVQFMDRIIAYMKSSLVTLAVKAKVNTNDQLWSSFGLKVVHETVGMVPEVAYSVEPAINEIVDSDSLRYAELLRDWKPIEQELHRLNTEEQWNHLLNDDYSPESYSGYPIELLARAFSIIEKMRSLVLEKTLRTATLNSLSNVPRMALLHRDLFAKSLAVTITGRGLRGD